MVIRSGHLNHEQRYNQRRGKNNKMDKRYNLANIPKEAQERCLFCAWKYAETVDKKTGEIKTTKIPYNVKTGEKAVPGNKATFATYAEAMEQINNEDYTGIGAGVFKDGDPSKDISFIDFDHIVKRVDPDGVAVLEDGNGSRLAIGIINNFKSRVELSPSFTGLRVYLRTLKSFKYDKDHYYINNPDKINNPIEFYFAGATDKYLTLTGCQVKRLKIENWKMLENERQNAERYKKKGAEVDGDTIKSYFVNCDYKISVVNVKTIENALNASMKRGKKEVKKGENGEILTIDSAPHSDFTKNWSDETIINKMLSTAGKTGEKIRELWNREINENGTWKSTGKAVDESASDARLLEYINFYTCNDFPRTIKLFRMSPYYKSKDPDHVNKFERKKAGQSEYINRTLRISFSPNIIGGVKDQEIIREDFETYMQNAEAAEPSSNIVVNKQTGAGSEQAAPKLDPNNNITNYIKNAYENDLNYFKENSGTKCGYRNIDKDQPFLPILYLIGGTTGSGKTTFCNQMAEHLARNENKYVLYFALEQTRFEHVNKIIARNMVIDKNGRGRFSSGDLQLNRAGDNMDYLETRRKVAEDLEGRLFIFDDVFNLNIEKILQTVEDFMKAHPGNKPVVFLDYLQILTPSVTAEGRRLDGMEQIDHAAQCIKQFQTKNQLAFVVISSFNRASYYEPAALESFKGSGGLEYTADLVAGIDFYFFHDKKFINHLDSLQKLTEKKSAIKARISEEFKKTPQKPRDMVLHTLKNRRFTPYQEYRFFYFSAYDLFVERGKVNNDYAKNYKFEDLLNDTTDDINYIYNCESWKDFKAAYYSSENDAQTSLNLQDETERPADAPGIAAADIETVEEYRARKTEEYRAKGLPEKNIIKTVNKEIEQKLKAGELVQDPAAIFDNPDDQDEQEEDEQEEDDSEED